MAQLPTITEGGGPAVDASDLPTHIGPFRIVRALGRGGMGVVYRGEHQDSGELAAIKTVPSLSERLIHGIRREVLALARIRHPGVVRIIAEGRSETGVPWYAMELLNGMTLRELTGTAPAKPERFAELYTTLLRLAAPLAFVHGEGLVHGDLKPENVFLRFDGSPVLVDFGLTSRFAGVVSREVLEIALTMGTPEYMAPEQWEGDPVDARTDLYALGCIIHELFAGEPPFSGSRDELRRAHLLEPPPSLRAIVPAAPVALEVLVATLLAKRPADRLGHAGEVARVLEGLGAPAGTDEEGPRPRPYLFRPGLRGRAKDSGRVVERVSSPGAKAKVVLLAGESGVGKTRLALELARDAQRGGMRVVTGECAPPGAPDASRPFAVFLPALRAAVDVARSGPQELARLFGPRLASLSRLDPVALGLLGAPGPIEPLDADGERARLLADMSATISALASTRPTFLVLDDLHWADALSLELIERLAGLELELSLLGTLRSESVGTGLMRLLQTPGLVRVDLDRLEPTSVAEMIGDMLGSRPPEAFASFLARQSEGNPFFVAEYLRAGIERGLLLRDARGQWQVASSSADSYATLGLPTTLHELVAGRINGLSADGRAVLDAACVLGREALADVLRGVAGLDETHTDEALLELLHRRILEEGGALRISHDKIREVGYALLSEPAKKALHRRAAQVLGERGAADSILAHHLEASDQFDLAMSACERAAEASVGAGAHPEARAFLERALSLEPRASAPVSPARRARWLRRIAETQLAGGDLRGASEHAGQSLALIGLPVPHSTGGWALAMAKEALAQLLHRLFGASAARASDGRERLIDATEANAILARVAFFENDPLRIITLALRSINLAEDAGHFFAAARNYSGLGWVLGLSGLPGLADAYFARARKAGSESRDFGGLIFCLTSEAVFRIGLGQWQKVRALLAACEEPCAITRDPQAWELMSTLAGHPDYFTGAFDAAIDRHRQVLRSARARRNAQHEAWSLYCIGRSLLETGAHAEAVAHLEDARVILSELSDEMSSITCLGLLARARLGQQDLERAEEAADACQALIGKKRPTVFLTMHGHEGIVAVRLARLRQRVGQRDGVELLDARRATRHFLSLGRLFPVTIPRASAYAARLEQLLGREQRARRALDRGHQAGLAMAMAPVFERAS